MGRGVGVAKGYNIFVLLLLVVQFIVLLGIIIVIAYFGTDNLLSLITLVSVVSLLVLCLPLSILQYLSTRDRDLRAIFLGLVLVYIISSISVILWYVVPVLSVLPWLQDFAQVLTLVTYLPLFASLLAVSRVRDLKIELYNKAAILFLSLLSILFVVFFVAANLGGEGVDLLDTSIYSASLVLDIACLSLISMMALTHMTGKLRYILSILLIIYLASTLADFFMLIDSLKLYDAFDYANLGYVAMIIFSGMALLAYSLGNIKIVTVEEVSRKLDDAELLTSDLIAQSPFAICMCEVSGTIVMANDGFLDICGKSGSEVIGRLNVFHDLPALGTDFAQHAQRARAGEPIIIDGIKVDRKGRKTAYFRLKIFPTHSTDGSVNNLVLFLDDITERKDYEDQLINAKKQTELYVDLMGHDVNNMNQIAMGFLEIAEDKLRREGRLGVDDLFMVSQPIEALANNSRLIYNIRKLQQEKAGAYRLEPVDVGRMLAGITPQYSAIAGRDVRVSLYTSEPCTVMANELLGDVFGNLLGNAIKHSEGPVAIDVTVVKTREGGREYCKVMVDDHGPGISDVMKDKLFDRLSIDGTRARGSGFGLCLSKLLVEDFGGRFWVEDRVPGEYREGARFVVLLPVIDCTQSQTLPEKPGQSARAAD